MALFERVFHPVLARRTQLALAFRVTVAAVAAFAIARAFHLALPLWAVLTSLIVTQMSVGRSIKVTTDYMMGTIGGAIYGGALALIPHSAEGALLALLFFTVAPLAFIGAVNPALNTATVTAVIVLLIPTMGHTSLRSNPRSIASWKSRSGRSRGCWSPSWCCRRGPSARSAPVRRGCWN